MKRQAGRMEVVRGVAIVLAILVASSPCAARPTDDVDTEIARRHFAAGSDFYDAGRYREAVREFEAARAVKPAPELDFNIGRAHDRLEEWAPAIEAYERYVASTPPPPDAEEIRARVRVLRGRLAPSTPASPSPPVGETPAPPPPASAPPSPPEARPAGSAAAPSPPEARPAGSAAAPSPPAASSAPPVVTSPAATDAWSLEGPASTARTPEASHEAAPSTPIYRRWWLWTVVAGAAVVAGVAIGAALYQPSVTYPSAQNAVGTVRF